MDYAYDFDADGHRLVLRDTPDGAIGVWSAGTGEWRARGLTLPEIDALIASGAFARRFTALRDVLHLEVRGPFEDGPPSVPGTA